MSVTGSDPLQTPVRAARLVFLLAAGAVLVRVLVQALTGITYEDSYISLRYAENLASGQGMVYNPGERVFGASTPLYVLLLAGLIRPGLPALLTAKYLAALADGVTLFLWGHFLLRRAPRFEPVLFFAALFGLSPLVVLVGVSGMETSFALLALTAALVSDLEDRPFGVGLGLGLLALLRPDGLLAAAVLLGLRWTHSREFPWRSAGLFSLIVLPWLLGATWYYGSPLPHSIPAKMAAYNFHRTSILPNLGDTLAQFAPIRGPWPRVLLNLAVFPALLLGLRAAWKEVALRPLACLFLAWWAYLVLPRTLLFKWYYPPLLLPAFVLAAVGLGEWLARPSRKSVMSLRPLVVARWGLALALVGALGTLPGAQAEALRIQRAEATVRRRIGLWLAANTPPDTRIALEPIGYVGYYSGRRILDEVGLVSPEMVPLNRQGDGWFAEMLRRCRPDYVVERPFYLLRNETLISQVRMFPSPVEREEFLAEYEPVAEFHDADVPGRLQQDYRFVVFARRTADSARRWRLEWERLPLEDRDDLVYRAISGPLKPPARASAAPVPR